MYFVYNNHRYCVNIDWLQFSVHLKCADPELICPKDYRIEICQGNNIFQHRAIVFDARGAKFITLLWKPFSKVLPANLMTCQVANEYLYMSGIGIKWAFDVLQEIVECSFNSISRIDICCDWQGNEKRTAFLNHLNSGHYYAQHKSEGAVWWHERGGYHHKELHCLNWGSQKSEIKVKIYNKSREQGLVDNPNAQPEKPWIVNEWKENKMDITKIWRIEFSLAGAGQLRYQSNPIRLDNVQDEEWIMNIFFDMYCHRFITRVNEGKRNGHKNNDTRVYLLNLPNRPNLIKWAEAKNKEYELPAAITLLRAMMRQIDNPAIMASRTTFEDYANTICNIIENHHLEGYFRRTYDIDSITYFENLYTNVGYGIQHTTPSPALLMD